MIASMILLLACCSPEHPVDKGGQKARSFTWTFDTLSVGSGQTLLSRLEGNSWNNVYALGFSSEGGPGAMLRFDGHGWSTTRYHFTEGGPVTKSTELMDAYIDANSVVWISGSSYEFNPAPPPEVLHPGLLLNYSQARWHVNYPEGIRFINRIEGRSPSDIWAGAWDGMMLHFNGAIWSSSRLPISQTAGEEIAFQDVAFTGPTLHALLSKTNQSTGARTFYHVRRDSLDWEIADSAALVGLSWGEFCLWSSASGILYSGGRGIYRFSNGSWRQVSSESFVHSLRGPAESDLLAVGTNGLALHFDADSFMMLQGLRATGIHFFDAWYDGTRAIILGQKGGKSIVAYGS